HLDDRGDPAVERAGRAVDPAFLVLEARIAEVHVDVDEAGDQGETPRLENWKVAGIRVGDDAVDDPEVDRPPVGPTARAADEKALPPRARHAPDWNGRMRIMRPEAPGGPRRSSCRPPPCRRRTRARPGRGLP